MLRFAISIVVLCAIGSAQGSNIDEISRRKVPGIGLRVHYGKGELQFGELRLPDTKGPYPVVVLVHGGCWVSKLRNLPVESVSMQGLRPMAAELAANGIATWNLEYRRLGNDGGGWPGTFQDLALGADHLRVLATKHPLDLRRTIVAGHSAGGHFALWLAGRKRIPKGSELSKRRSLKFRGAVNLDGPGDLRATIPMAQAICGAPVISQLIGGEPEQFPERYRAASPVEMLPIGVTQETFAGRMFASLVPAYEEAARKAGDKVHSTVDPEAGHFDWIDPKSAKWPEVLAAIQKLLER